jgi:hypothetical protein
MKIKYQDIRFKVETLGVIEKVNDVAESMERQGYSLTLRQVYYRMVAAGHIPNNMQSYKRLGSIVNDGRLAGLIDWNHIVDRTRNLEAPSHWQDPAHMVQVAADSHRLDKWKGQDHRVEVWVEKEALADVIGQAANREDVPHFACRGYVSQSEQWAAGRRLKGYIARGITPVIIHLGDHDPSGIDMTRDIIERIEMFAEGYVEVKRIALNMDQVERYDPPPNPAKMTDSRFESYERLYGDESWELDALEPQMLDILIRKTIRSFRTDEAQWLRMVKLEAEERAYLQQVATNWRGISKYIDGAYGKPEVDIEEEELLEDEDE